MSSKSMRFSPANAILILLFGLLATACTAMRPPVSTCFVEDNDILLGPDPGNSAVLKAAKKRISESKEVAWFRSPDSTEYKLCILSSELQKHDGCRDSRETYSYQKRFSKWKDDELKIEWEDDELDIKWVEIERIECVILLVN